MSQRALDRLTKRQRQVLDAMVRGLTAKETARELGVAPKTVESHIAAMFFILGVRRKTQALRVYFDAQRAHGTNT